MGAAAYVILPAIAFLTATLSGMIGMGGGMLLLASLFCFMPHAEAVPSHAAVQLISNSTRTLAFLAHVDWRTVGRFAVGLIPGSLIGVIVLKVLGEADRAEPYLKALVGLYILTSLVLPRRAGETGRFVWWDFPLLGLLAGAAALTVGAVGPLIAPLFARRAFVKERLIATKAVCQSIVHILKIPVFLTLRTYEDLIGLSVLTLAMALLVVPGTLLGKRLLKHLSERHFLLLYRLALLVAGLKVLLADGLLPILNAR